MIRQRTKGRPPAERAHVVRTLRRQIVSGHYNPGDRLHSRRALAERFGVAPVTVDEAFNLLEADGFVQTMGTAGRFVAGCPPHLHQFALILPLDPYHGLQRSRFYNALMNDADRVTNSDSDRFFQLYTNISGHVDCEDYQQLVRDVRDEKLAGLIFAFPGVAPYGNRIVDAGNIPQVAIATNLSDEIPAVYPDMHAWLARALDHVAQQGRRRVAMVQLPYLGNFEDWQRELKNMCARKGVQTAPWLTQFVPGHAGYDPRNVGNAIQLLMRLPRNERPDALLVTDDHLAEGAAQGLAAAGIVPGRDITVVAHCNWPAQPPIEAPWTWLGFNARKIMQTCIDRIEEQRNEKEVPPMTWIAPEFATPETVSP